MDFETILFDVSDGVARITLNRPESANGMNKKLLHELMLAAIRCDEDREIRAALLTGTGKMFSAGGDLKAFSAAGDDVSSLALEMTTYIHAAVSRFSRMDAPLIVAVNGTAAGGGLSLAVSGDLVIAAESAKFVMAYTAGGLSPDGSSTYFLPRLIGLRRAQELTFTNRLLSATEALEWGLVTSVVPDDALEQESTALAQKLAQGPTFAHGIVKKLFAESFTNPLETQMELESRGLARTIGSADGREGITAFLEKRKPNFTGG